MMEMVMGKMPENVAREAVNHKPEFFKDGPKLNWPLPKTTKQSRKDVRATRSLQVSLVVRTVDVQADPATGNNTTNRYDQRALLGPCQEVVDVRPEAADNRSRGVETPLLFASDSTRTIGLLSCTAQIFFFSHLRIEPISPGWNEPHPSAHPYHFCLHSRTHVCSIHHSIATNAPYADTSSLTRWNEKAGGLYS